MGSEASGETPSAAPAGAESADTESPDTETGDPESAVPKAISGRRRRRVIRIGTEDSAVAGSSRDERDEGWSDSAARSIDNAHDAELRRNLPPHWS